MGTRCRLIHRGARGGIFYCVGTKAGKRTSLQTGNEEDARQVINAKNRALRQPVLNLQIAKACLYGTDNGIATRTWQQALDALISVVFCPRLPLVVAFIFAFFGEDGGGKANMASRCASNLLRVRRSCSASACGCKSIYVFSTSIIRSDVRAKVARNSRERAALAAPL